MSWSLPNPGVFETLARPLGRYFKKIHHYPVVESTNDLAALMASKGCSPYLGILADHQTRGRGQQEKTWFARPGQSMLLSLVFPVGLKWARPSAWCALVATAILDLIKNRTGIHARIKWPNDVLIDGRKIAGILIEQSHAVIVGIGLNIHQTDADFRLLSLGQACSISQFCKERVSLEEIMDEFLDRLETRLQELESGQTYALESAWNFGLNLEGKEVLAETTQKTFRAILEKVTLNQVILKDPDGSSSHFAPEEIRHLFPLERE